MREIVQNTKSVAYRGWVLAVVLVLGLFALQSIFISTAYAAQITTRTLTLSSSSPEAANATTTYTFTFNVPTTATALQSFGVEICTTASGTCTTPTGFSASGATLASQPTALGADTGWTDASTAGVFQITNASGATPDAGQVTVEFQGVQNPTTTNQTFFGRMTTYSDAAYTTAVDSGVVAASTAEQIDLTGTVDETLVFQTGTSGSCGSLTGSTVNFGTFSSSSTSTGTSLMCASTNGVGGYTVTVNGSTLTCLACSGTPSIDALATQTASATDTAQFGLNLKDNATPNVGAEASGGTGSAATNYGTADQYRFVTGDGVATAAGATDSTLYTVSYVVNIPGSQPAGVYTATMTYIATATF